MLHRVTATQQCVSTRCDLWWEKEILRSLVPVFSHMSITLSVTNAVQPSRAACERERVGGVCLYCWRILCDVINCGTVTTIWYCDQRNPWHCSRVELPPCLRYQWLAQIQRPAGLFIAVWLAMERRATSQFESGAVQKTCSTVEGIHLTYCYFAVVQYNRDQFWLKPC